MGLEKISLPSGPGSIEGLGDAFEPQLNSGTSSYSVSISAPPGVAGLQPSVVLRYNSGAGNSPFGVAWSYSPMSIQRQVEKGLPVYGASDSFTLNGEELVLLTDGSYRTENESAFRRITRDGSGWIVTEKNGTRHFLGSTAMNLNPSRLIRPGAGETFTDTYKWCVDTVIDVHGNRMEYRYVTFADSPGNHYLNEIRYSIFGNAYHSIDFVWETRPDAFSSFLSGFEIRTAKRCHQIRVLSQGALVRRYGLRYELPASDPIEPIGVYDAGQLFSQLRQFVQFDKGATDNNFLPPLRFGYTRFDPLQVERGSFASPLVFSLGDANVSISDINADGLPDFFYTEAPSGTHTVVYNQGFTRFSVPTVFTSAPIGVTLDQAGVNLADYDGDGRVDLVQKAGGSTGIFHVYPNMSLPVDNLEASPSWGSALSYNSPFPPFDLNDPTVRTLDLDNDKRIDFMRSSSAGFIYYYNLGDRWVEDGMYLFGEAQLGDITFGDAIDFSDGVHTKLADLNGDRLLDLCRISLFQNELQVTFWPNKGRGSWGNRVVMGGSVDLGVIPLEDVFLRDLNGDGLADVMAVAYDEVSYWLNLGNNQYSRRFVVDNTPEYIKGTTQLQQADINGNGTTDLLWENFDGGIGGYRIDYIDFVGETKSNLLAVIDNGIGLRTEIEYRPSHEFYAEALLGANPWRTRLPFPSWCVSKISKRFGLDLDALPGEDRYVTEFSYHDGYYDPFEKEFRGFAFARKVERGDDRLTEGGPAPEINSPSTLTRMAFHTGLPDGLDNDGDNQTDEFDPVSGYEEEALKGKVIWTETTLLTAEFDGVDSDGDGFVDESDEGAGSGLMSGDAVTFKRESQVWALKSIHDASGGFTQPGISLPYATADGRKVTFPFPSESSTELIEAVGSLHSSSPYSTGVVTLRTETEVDFFGNPTLQKNFGVQSGGALGSYDDEKFTHSEYGFNVADWIVGLPTEQRVTDEHGNFVSKTRTFYDDQAYGVIGSRGLATASEQFIGSSAVAMEQFSEHPGDPRASATDSVITRTVYDSFGNPRFVRDPLYGIEAGHQRELVYDSTFQTYVVEERIDTGGPGGILVAEAQYDLGAGVVTRSEDFNDNETRYLYDSFFRIVGIVKPGDSDAFPTQVFEYKPGDIVRGLQYIYDAAGNLSLSVSGNPLQLSEVLVRSRESAGGGTFDIVQVTDGAGHKLGTIEEGETPGQYVYKEVKRYTSRGQERDSYLPFFAGNPSFRSPPVDGDRVTNFMDALGRTVRTVNPPETAGGTRTETRTDYLPLLTVLFDEEDLKLGGNHHNTPYLQYQDGLERLVGVDEINQIGADTGTFETRYTYDLLDNLVRIEDSLNNLKWMRHDGLRRMIFMEDPDRGKMFYTYDVASNLRSTVDAKNQQIDYSYDGANRILSEDYLDAAGLTPDVAYHYDVPQTVDAGDQTDDTSEQVRGKLSYITDLSGSEYLSYDNRGRIDWKIKRIPDPKNGALVSYQNRFEYDSLDRVKRLHYPDLDYVDYLYNSRNLPEAITGGPSGFIISNIDYIASGQMDTILYGNGVDTDYDYDPRLRLNKLRTQNDTLGEDFIWYTYSFDGASNITRIDDNRSGVATELENTQVFAYDDLYRLTRVDYPVTVGHVAYSYDRIGNMLSKTSNIVQEENGLSVTNLGVMSYGGSTGKTGRQGRDLSQPGPHALTAVANGNRAYPYDYNGNMTDIDGLSLEWDFKDRLIAAENSEMRAEYTYDYTDRRITKKVVPKDGSRSTSVQYPDRTFEVREYREPVKYVWNGETRVARVTTNLNTTQKIQRFALHAGQNILSLAIQVDNAGTQLSKGNITAAYRYDPVNRNYHIVAANETLPMGTLVWVMSSTSEELPLQGTYNPSDLPVSITAGNQWVPYTRLTPLKIDEVFPASAILHSFDEVQLNWEVRFSEPITIASTLSETLEVGTPFYVIETTDYVLMEAGATLDFRFYHQDHLGSSNYITDNGGGAISEMHYYPFGALRVSGRGDNCDETYGFSQKEKDAESNLAYFATRYQSNTVCRFISVDDYGLSPPLEWLEKPKSLNLYLYAEGNPVKYIDPTGEFVNSVMNYWNKSVEIGDREIAHMQHLSGLEKRRDQLRAPNVEDTDDLLPYHNDDGTINTVETGAMRWDAYRAEVSELNSAIDMGYDLLNSYSLEHAKNMSDLLIDLNISSKGSKMLKKVYKAYKKARGQSEKDGANVDESDLIKKNKDSSGESKQIEGDGINDSPVPLARLTLSMLHMEMV